MQNLSYENELVGGGGGGGKTFSYEWFAVTLLYLHLARVGSLIRVNFGKNRLKTLFLII